MESLFSEFSDFVGVAYTKYFCIACSCLCRLLLAAELSSCHQECALTQYIIRKGSFIAPVVLVQRKGELLLVFLVKRVFIPINICNFIIYCGNLLSDLATFVLYDRWEASSCAMDSLYDIDLISETNPVILDNSEEWHQVLSTSMKLGARGVAHVEGVSRVDLKENDRYSNLLLINRTASPLSW